MEFRSCAAGIHGYFWIKTHRFNARTPAYLFPAGLSASPASVSCTDDGRLSGDLFRWKKSLAR